MYPAGGVATFRTPKGDKDVVLGGGRLVVPPGVGLHMPITAVHHSRDLWENPEAFIPERFLEVRPRHAAPVELLTSQSRGPCSHTAGVSFGRLLTLSLEAVVVSDSEVRGHTIERT